MQAGEITADEVTALDRRVSEEMAAARKFALESPLPAAETAFDHVFA
jgi:TPP-dependent pyruvate/acetoin dehydrogenase alpha subunit